MMNATFPMDSDFFYGITPPVVDILPRQQMSTDLLHRISNLMNHPEQRAMLVHGASGAGKTILVASTATFEKLEPLGIRALAWINVTELSTRAFAIQLAKKLEIDIDIDKPEYIVDQLSNGIQTKFEGKRILVVIDDAYDGQVDRTLLSLPKQLKFLCISRNRIMKVPSLFTPDPFSVEALSKEEAKELFDLCYSKAMKQLAPNRNIQLAKQHIEKLVDDVAGQLPMWISVISWTVAKKLSTNNNNNLDQAHSINQLIDEKKEMLKGNDRGILADFQNLETQMRNVCYAIACYGQAAVVPINKLSALLNYSMKMTKDVCMELHNRYLLRVNSENETCTFHSLIFEVIIDYAATKELETRPFFNESQSTELKSRQLRFLFAKNALNDKSATSFFGRLIEAKANRILPLMAEALTATESLQVLFDLCRQKCIDGDSALNHLLKDNLYMACDFMNNLIFWNKNNNNSNQQQRSEVEELLNEPLEALIKTVQPGCTRRTSALHLAADHNMSHLIEEMTSKESSILNVVDKENDTALMRATKMCCKFSIQKLLKSGADPNLADNNQMTPLMRAVRFKYGIMAEIVVKYSKTIQINDPRDAVGNSTLVFALLCNNDEAALMLLDKGVDFDESTNRLGIHCLTIALCFDLENVVAKIIERDPTLKKANFQPSDETMAKFWLLRLQFYCKVKFVDNSPLNEGLIMGLKNDDFESVVSLLRENFRGDSLNTQIEACCLSAVRMDKSFDFFKRLVEEFQIKDFEFSTTGGKTCLMFAVANGNVEIVDFLLENRCAVNSTDKQGRSALLYAARYDQGEITKHLANHFLTDIQSRDAKDRTPLHFACELGSNNFIKALVNVDARLPPDFLNVRDDLGWTPLMLAVLNEQPNAIRALFSSPKHRPDLTIVNKQGQDIFQYAKYLKKDKMIKVIREFQPQQPL